MALSTQSFMDRIAYLGPYDPVYRKMPQQDGPAFFQEVCDRWNQFIQEEAKNLASASLRTYNTVTGSSAGYTVLDTTEGGTIDGQWTTTNLVFYYGNLSYPLQYVDNETFLSNTPITSIQGMPAIWTWYLPLQQIWVYPVPITGGVFRGLGRSALPQISVTVNKTTTPWTYTFTPTTLPLDTEYNFVDYAQYAIAEAICDDRSIKFSDQKRMRMQKTYKTLINNKQPNFKLNTTAPQLGMSNRGRGGGLSLYFLSGGGNL